MVPILNCYSCCYIYSPSDGRIQVFGRYKAVITTGCAQCDNIINCARVKFHVRC